MNILAIDTASAICGVSIEKENIIKTYDKDATLQHSVVLPYMIEEALQDSDISIKNISYIAVSNGPGSYTGLRIGVSMAIGLSTSDNIPIVYVDTIEQMSHNIDEKENSYILPMIDAKAGRVYTALFNGKHERITKDEIQSIDNIIELIKKYLLKKKINLYILGDAVEIYKDKLSILKKYKNIKFVSKKMSLNNTKSLIKASYKYFNNEYKKEPVNINYMQASQAERNLKK